MNNQTQHACGKKVKKIPTRHVKEGKNVRPAKKEELPINRIMEMNDWLSNWHKLNCNGDWEHTYGIKIETLDNPGWLV